ncbi:MAG: 2-oxo acid dehydrogenase subunit E2 [Clostridia bacterium]|nr:2-oxo acid dehydrogenase subunit E2 [Clostridia bacterium]
MRIYMRADGKRLKNTDPMYTIAPHIMSKRMDSMNMTTIDIPYEPMKEYINKKRKENIHISHMALILAAYVRTMAEFPELNRFIVNKRIYARNEIAVGMVVLQSLESHEGTMSKMYFEITDTVFDINNKINSYVNENRESPENNGTEKIMKILLSVPGLVNVGVVAFKILDKFGLLPKAIIDMSPFHMSLGITNLASIRTNHIYHHCYEFGTTSIFMAMGNLREIPKRKGDEITLVKTMPIGVTMDERICSGSYFASAFRVMKKYLANPELLESPPEKIVQDPGK